LTNYKNITLEIWWYSYTYFNCYLYFSVHSGCRKCITLSHQVKEWPHTRQWITVSLWIPQGWCQWY